MIDERELSDIKLWHYHEGGLDNRGQVINRMIDTIEDLLKIARAAQDVVKETSEHNPLWERVRTKYIVALNDALSVLPPVEDKEPGK